MGRAISSATYLIWEHVLGSSVSALEEPRVKLCREGVCLLNRDVYFIATKGQCPQSLGFEPKAGAMVDWGHMQMHVEAGLSQFSKDSLLGDSPSMLLAC